MASSAMAAPLPSLSAHCGTFADNATMHILYPGVRIIAWNVCSQAWLSKQPFTLRKSAIVLLQSISPPPLCRFFLPLLSFPSNISKCAFCIHTLLSTLLVTYVRVHELFHCCSRPPLRIHSGLTFPLCVSFFFPAAAANQILNTGQRSTSSSSGLQTTSQV